ncbi:two-component system, OmpR family, sensor kinase/two-component system, OmpR family, sensor histidine kinase QseC [Noviherbaspirillum humi]|uniref:histidine kinase n=1 Tax=Noviherbaspirillum humi TaxID=1688639 RepID=A0A239E5W0_9BURK|nr:ATP-binding protein [Noviherbaspirillum humi]SNS40120.1 two-component system, OmpR family, sensor kinase/two-component system, OmpR family, sensor histidine kinase QseC [Noviherbaspirillum humi]
MMQSLRARLSLFLLLSTVAAALAIGLLTYRQTLQQAEDLFDYQLRQTALSLRDQGVAAGLPPGFNGEQGEVVVQIWTANGAVLYLSHPGSALPDRATLGFSDVDAGGRRWRVYSFLSGDRVIQVAQPRELRRDLAAAAAWRSLRPLLLLGPLLALLIGWQVTLALRPLQRLAREVKQRDAGSLEPVAAAGLPSEIAPVAQALNALLWRLKDAFAAQRAFMADAAHELRSPLTALRVQLQLLERAPDESARRGALAQLHLGVERAGRLIEQLLLAARSEADSTPAMAPVDLAELTRRVMAEAFPLAQQRRIGLDLEAPDSLVLTGDPEGLRAVVRNLFDNALRYTPEGGEVRGRLGQDETGVTLAVEDSGPGIPEEERDKVFQRFYRGQSAAPGGSGLGLSIVRSIAERHHADVRLGRSALGGLKAEVRFPLESAAAAPDSATASLP